MRGFTKRIADKPGIKKFARIQFYTLENSSSTKLKKKTQNGAIGAKLDIGLPAKWLSVSVQGKSQLQHIRIPTDSSFEGSSLPFILVVRFTSHGSKGLKSIKLSNKELKSYEITEW
ncbi:hypothetical protein NPIL_677081 [Nephila pilipes]|uniref:Uncharacterized protein n=1 Tax=Nephila pilipes TaxID=299642 RepID=A0A8X6NDY4_NEPPI|nr:hypothetical protein NPIL_677081 [Nephila pilipes]